MSDNVSVEVIEFTDPLCTWCWGSEPILRKLETHYRGGITISYVMGGLVEDIRGFSDPRNGIGGTPAEVNAQVARHWLEASERHGMPVDADGFAFFSEESVSTYPVNIAYKAAQFQGEQVANRFLRRMREAAAAEGREVYQTEVLIELAQESGLDVPAFLASLSDGSADSAFRADLAATRSRGVRGFPSFLVTSSTGKEVMLRGYQSCETFREVIKQITDGRLAEIPAEKTQAAVLALVEEYRKVAPVEIATNFDMSPTEVDAIVESLTGQGLVGVVPAGNGRFVEPVSHPLSCDPATGACG